MSFSPSWLTASVYVLHGERIPEVLDIYPGAANRPFNLRFFLPNLLEQIPE
jgi:hypothetical protein